MTLGLALPCTLTFPLDVMYRDMGIDPPVAEVVERDQIPPPYHTLLVHSGSMTLRLEAFFRRPMQLRLLTSCERGIWYLRHVLLVEADTGRPAEMAAIRIRLGAFSQSVHRRITAEQVPLGHAFRDAGLAVQSEPQEFFMLVPNADMQEKFAMDGPRPLYGRRTKLLLNGESIADVVEVLPRFGAPQSRTHR